MKLLNSPVVTDYYTNVAQPFASAIQNLIQALASYHSTPLPDELADQDNFFKTVNETSEITVADLLSLWVTAEYLLSAIDYQANSITERMS